MKQLIFCIAIITFISCSSSRNNSSSIWQDQSCTLERLEYQEVSDTLHRTKNGGIEGGVTANGKAILSDKINIDSVKAYLNAGNKVFISQTTFRTVKVSQDFWEKYNASRKNLCDAMEAMKKSNNFSPEAKKRAENIYLDIVEMNAGLEKKNSIANQKVIDRVIWSTYKIDKSDISFDYNAKLITNTKFFEKYNKRLLDSFKVYKQNPNRILPNGTFRFNNQDENDKITLIGLTITPTSILYPSEQSENNVFKLIGQAGLDISLCRSDSLNSGPCSSLNADLSFSTQTIKPTLTYWFNDSIIEVEAKDLKPNKDDLSWRNKGGIESLVDLSEGQVSLNFSDRITNELDNDGLKLSESYSIYGFKFNVSSRIFASFKLCKTSEKYPQYYLNLPKEILQTHLDMECK